MILQQSHIPDTCKFNKQAGQQTLETVGQTVPGSFLARNEALVMAFLEME